ncbi:unnamed protein product [Soboliphyme baturini]|uniref:TROVE domain-containing protein n=1 Tax=Soboliphyme baturini TaxID=241478 RepID=A0A3P8DKK2_9BILA|nr:unnamed protein product [Soboliphyme baturini]
MFLGWGRSHRNAIKHWYFDKDPRDLALAVTKYRERQGWSHLDVLRLAHPKPGKEQTDYDDIFLYVKSDFEAVLNRKRKRDDESKGERVGNAEQAKLSKALQLLEAVAKLKKMTDAAEAAKLIREYRLVREHVPTQLLKNADIWRALLPDMPLTALMRNLSTMTCVGLLTDTSDETNLTILKLRNSQALRKARIHPFSALVAFYVYKSGRKCFTSIVCCLEDVFYESFSLVEPTGKRFLVALDVSGSMESPIRGSPLQCNLAAAAMCMLHVRSEPQCDVVCFSDELSPISLTKSMKLEEVLDVVKDIPMGATDCALPMLWATKHEKKYDVFIVYTDNDTWFGQMHPFEALLRYREKSGILNAKLIVVGMTATDFTIADPNDGGMLDVVGFDTAAPEIMSQFILERI